MISRVRAWGDLIQAVSTQLLLPGTNLSVDEIVILKGRSLGKGTNESGLKILAAAEKGYLLRWEYHIPRAAQTPARRREHSHSFAEKQRLVLDLAVSLPPATYHILFDKLFSTSSLIKALRERGVAATGRVLITMFIAT
jgi:hypothetical protein